MDDELNPKENEQNEVIQNQSKHYILGILGALIGALVASIPWILMYVYGNMILSALAILIAIGALKGYQIFKGSIDKKLPFIISIISLLVVVFTTLVVIPLLLIAKDGYIPNIENLKLLYASNEFFAALMQDLIISVIFTILGISGVVSNVNKQIKESNKPLNEIKISSTLSNTNNGVDNTQVINSVKDVFVKYDALSKENAIEKSTILEELQQLPNGKQLFTTLKSQQIIRKHKGKYYFSEKMEQSLGRRFLLLFGKIMLVIIIVAAVVIGVSIYTSNSSKPSKNNTNTNSINNTASATYPLKDFHMEVVIPSNMTLASESDLAYLSGESADFYEFVLYNKDEMISCFTQKAEIATVNNYYEYLKNSFASDKNCKILSDYKEEKIAGFKFNTMEAQAKNDDGSSYNYLYFGYFVDNQFVCFEYSYPSESKINAKQVFSNMIKKIK